MAGFKFDGIDYISAKFDELGQGFSEEEKLSVITPAAEMLKTAYTKTLELLFRVRTGTLSKSINIDYAASDEGASAFVAPKGKHPKSFTGKRMKKVTGTGKRRSSGKYSGTNMEIAYILEYGSPRISATHWMENANEEMEDELYAAQSQAWDDLLARKGL